MAGYFKTLGVRWWVLGVSCWLMAVGLFSSCQEGRDAGDLWGQWRMADSDRLYISFSDHIARLQDTHHGEIFVYGNFQHVGDSIFLQCFSKDGVAKDTTMVEETFGFKPFNNIRLKVVSVSGDNLVLGKGQQTWNFQKH